MDWGGVRSGRRDGRDICFRVPLRVCTAKTVTRRPSFESVLTVGAISDDGGCTVSEAFICATRRVVEVGAQGAVEGIACRSFFPLVLRAHEVVMNNSTGEQHSFKGLFTVFFPPPVHIYILFSGSIMGYVTCSGLIESIMSSVKRRSAGTHGRRRGCAVRRQNENVCTLTGQQLQISRDFCRRLLDDVCHATRGYGGHGHDDCDRGRASDEHRADLPPYAGYVVEPEITRHP